MKLKERINKLEGKIGKKDKGWLVAHLRPIRGEESFSVIINGEEIGVFPTEEEANKAVDKIAGEKRVLLIKLVSTKEDLEE